MTVDPSRTSVDVSVPAALAGEVYAALVLGLAVRVRRDGARLSPATQRLLADLRDAADRHARGCATATDLRVSFVQRETMTTAEAATRLGCTQTRVRALAASGRLRGRRTARVWLLDPRSVNAYRVQRGHHG
jgi:excisionase family DNA binding protein